MATLEKIRNKSVLLIVVIGVALLAFIVGDFFTSGRTFFGNTTTAAVVGSDKIDIQEFQRRYEEMSAQMQQQNQTVDAALVQRQVLESMIQERLLDKEIEDLGITVSDEELSESMVGKNASPQIMQFAQQMGVQSPAQLYDMIFNPTNYSIPEEQVAQARAEWLKMEKSTEQQLKYMKLGALISGGIQANDLEKKAINNESAISHIFVVKKDYASLKDADFKVSDEEIKAQYEKDKEKYKLDQETRRIHYIAVDVKPSATDEAAAQKIVDQAVADLKANPGIDAIRSNSDLFIKESTTTLAAVTNPQLKDFISASEIEAVSPTQHIGDTYSMTKLVGKKIETDSVKVNMVAVEGAKAVQDSVLALLNKGTAIAAVEKVKGVKGAQADMWIDLTKLAAQENKVKAKILGAPAEYFVLDSNENGALLYQVLEKKAPKQMYEIAEVSYKLMPSDETIQNLRDGLQNFLNSNTSTANFTANAIKAGFQAIETFISTDLPQIDRIPSTRKSIQWAFKADEGTVSPIFDEKSNNKLIAVALDEIVPAGYTPITDKNLRTELTNIIIRDKKAAKLIADYKGKAKDLNGYASIMGTSVDTTTTNFAQPFSPMLGYEPALAGRVSATKVGMLGGPVKGNNAIYFFQVTSVDNNGPKLSPQESADRYSAALGGQAVMQNAVEILRKATTVKNELIKFY